MESFHLIILLGSNMKYSLRVASRYNHHHRDVFSAIMTKQTKCSIGKWVALGRKYPNEYEVQRKICLIYRIYKKRKEALTQWRRLDKKFPNHARHYFMRSFWEIRNENYQLAIFYMKRYMKLDMPRGFYRNQASYFLAVCFFELGMFNQAEIALMRVPKKYSEFMIKNYRGKGKEYILRKIKAQSNLA